MDSETKLSFDNLEKEVIQKGICGRCGGCVSFCAANRIGALELGQDGFPTYSDKDKCLECGLCYLLCPQTEDLNEELKEKFNWKPPIGHFEEVFSLRATDKNVLDTATDGGFVTSLLLNMLENKTIDGAVVSQSIGLFTRKPIVATSSDDLMHSAGSQFSESPHLEEVGAGYSSYVPVIKTIRDFGSRPIDKIAVVGTPCQINAVRKMQLLEIVPADIIVFTIGLFCMQCFAMDDLIHKQFAEKHQIDLESISKINIKEHFILTMKSGITIHIPLEEIEMIAKPACLACKSFANDFADISVGGLGSVEGYTTVVVRSIMGKRMVADALQKGVLEHKITDSKQASEVEKNSRISLIATFADQKKKRGERTLDRLRVQTG